MESLKVIILLSVILLSLGVNGQMNYKKGYIVINENDTLHGKINDGGGKRNSKVCLFKEKNKQKGIKYYPGDIKAYRIDGDKYYASKKIEINGQDLDVFLEVLIKGKVSLYHSLQDRKMSFYIEMIPALTVFIMMLCLNMTIRKMRSFFGEPSSTYMMMNINILRI